MNLSRTGLTVAIGAAVAGSIAAYLAIRTPATRDPSSSAKVDKVDPTPSPFVDRDRATSRHADEPTPRDPAEPLASPTEPPAAADPRARPEQEPPPPSDPIPAPPQSPTAAETRIRAMKAATAAIGKVHSKMRGECWNDLADKPDSAQIAFSLTYDAQGKVISAAVQQLSRENYRTELATCLSSFAQGLAIEAPGESVSVDVPFELP